MKITQNTVIFLALGALAGIVIYKNVMGKKDKEPNYAGDPKFTNPLS
jgi:hypothetical protein